MTGPNRSVLLITLLHNCLLCTDNKLQNSFNALTKKIYIFFGYFFLKKGVVGILLNIKLSIQPLC